MALSSRIEIRQGQSLVMTPQLQQSIKLLQLNNLELAAFVEAELEQNPLLEQQASDDHHDLNHAEPEPGASDADPLAADQALAQSENMPDGAEMPDLDAPDEDLWRGEAEAQTSGPATSDTVGPTGGGAQPDRMTGNALENTADQVDSLRDHLVAQLAMEFDHPFERIIANRLIDDLDDSGYFQSDLSAVSAVLGCEPELVEAVLLRAQKFDPAGVFARNLSECLALQLKDQNRFDPAMEKLVDNLEMLAANELDDLRQICDVDEDDFADMLVELRRLNPKPGQAFGFEPVVTVIPDVFIRPGPDGGWIVELNNDTLPRVLINSSYYAQLSGSVSGKDREFVNSCFQTANWLVRSLDQRARTILKVGQELVRQQKGFIVDGVQALRPLTLRDVAEAIEMHESTVSRVCANKYVATPRGLFEMRSFFSGSIANSSGGESHAADAVRERIRQLIGAEASGKVLSDDAIAQTLGRSGIDIARRTVAKYREAMHIPSSTQRRRTRASENAARPAANC